jgi:hypothetical protein
MQPINTEQNEIAHDSVSTAFETRARNVFALVGDCRSETESHSHPPTPAMVAAFDMLMRCAEHANWTPTAS